MPAPPFRFKPTWPAAWSAWRVWAWRINGAPGSPNGWRERLRQTGSALEGGQASRARAWRWGATGLLCAGVCGALYLGAQTQAQHRNARAADALALAWTQALAEQPAGGLDTETALALLRPLALAAGVDLRVENLTGQGIWQLAAAEPARTRVDTSAALLTADARLVQAQGQSWQLRVQAPVADLQHNMHGAMLLSLLAALASLAGAEWLAQRRRRRLQAAVAATLAQARSLGEAGYLAPGPLAQPELRPLAQAMDQLHQRLRALYEVHAQQLETLRRQAHTDPVTGLPNRRHFLAVVEALLGGEGAPAEAGLVLLRLADLQGMNQRLGGRATDQLLQALAEVLGTHPQRTPRCAVGRLTGSDFGLLLPAGGIAHDTAQQLAQALRAPLAALDAAVRFHVGAVELRPPLGADQALVMAQAALAGAEAAPLAPREPAEAAEITSPAPRPAPSRAAHRERLREAARDPARDEVVWQRALARALVQGRVRLGAYPVCAVDGRQLMLDSPLRVQFSPGGPYEPAARWLDQATRNRLNTAVDEKAVMLALAATAQDGEVRGVAIAAASAMAGDFVNSLTRRLASMPEAAACLWLHLPEALALAQPELVRELTQRWRPLGARVALEHCGEGLLRVPRLIDLGLDGVRIDSRFVNGIAADHAEDARRYLQGLVRLVQSLGLAVTAEGVRSADDLALLWQMGFDAASGPALSVGSAAVA